jgi:uncharacterized protein (DUF1810 family)
MTGADLIRGMAQHYAVRDLDHARHYLADSILGPRLRQVVRLIMDQKGKSALEILGSPDDLKLRSCLTLFRDLRTSFMGEVVVLVLATWAVAPAWAYARKQRGAVAELESSQGFP